MPIALTQMEPSHVPVNLVSKALELPVLVGRYLVNYLFSQISKYIVILSLNFILHISRCR